MLSGAFMKRRLIGLVWVGTALVVAAVVPDSVLAAESSPSSLTTFASAPLGYSVQLPPAWRRSLRLSGMRQDPSVIVGVDVFTVRTPGDEAAALGTSDITGPAFDHALVIEVWANPSRLTASQWASSRLAGSRSGQRVDQVTVGAQSATRITNGSTYTVAHFISRGTQMYVLGYSISPTPTWWPAGLPESKLRTDIDQIVQSFVAAP